MAGTAQAHGIDNPNSTAALPAVPPSNEEKRINRYLVIGMLAFLAIVIGMVTATMSWSLEPLRENAQPEAWQWRSAVALVVLLTLMALPILAMIGRWPGELRVQGEIEIKSSAADIWSSLAYRPGMQHWKGIYRLIERVDGSTETYLLHMYSDANCTECGLPKHPDAPGLHQQVDVIEAREPDLYHVRSFPKGRDLLKGEAANWIDFEENCYTISALPDGAAKVSLDIRVQRPKLWMAALLKLGGPVTQSLTSLKNHLEGRDDDTLFATARARIAAARLAPRHCGCATVGIGLALV
jgi:hypothetical protein